MTYLDYDDDEDFGGFRSWSFGNKTPIKTMSAEELLELARKRHLEQQKERASRMVQVIGTYASVLALQPVRCYLSTSGVAGGAPAWSDSGAIGFDLASLPDLSTPGGAMVVKGLAIHEIGHILFTARIGTELRDFVIENDYSVAYNILEDCRLEALMIGRFGSSVSTWLTGVVASYITNQEPEMLTRGYPLVAGRHYLPVELRQAIRSVYFEQENSQAIHDLASEYRTLLFDNPTSIERGMEIVEAFDALLEKQDKGSGGGGGRTCGIPDPFGHDTRPENENSGGAGVRQAKNKQQKQARDKAEKSSKPEPVTGGYPGQPGDNKSPIEEQVTDASDIIDRTATEGGDTEVIDPVLVAEVKNQAQILVDNAEEVLIKELNSDLEHYSGKSELLATKVSDLGVAAYNLETPSTEAINGSKEFLVQLQRIKNDFMPDWVRRVSEGKINASRYLLGCELDEAFDRFDEGNDEVASIEAVIILDKSGSMGNEIKAAYEAMWAIKKALDTIGASTSVLTFSDNSKVLYPAQDTATAQMRTFGCGGGTQPQEAIIAAKNIFATSTRPIKMFLAITDGEWYSYGGDTTKEDTIAEMRHAGVLTSLISIGYKSKQNHNCELVADISGTGGLFNLAKDLVSIAIKRNLAHF